MNHNFKLINIFILFGLGISACTLGKNKTFTTKTTTPAKMYKYGIKQMKSGDYDNALKTFKKLKKLFPMSLKYSVLTEIKIADTHRLNEHFGTAASAYRDFMKNHPLNKYVTSGYTTYMIAYCNYRLGPGNFFLFPPAYEKDLTNIKSAYIVFKIFLRKYPNSKYIKKARKYYKKTLNMLAAHEWYVANYYTKKKNSKAVQMRLEYLVNNYPNSKYTPKASFLLAKLYLKNKEIIKARKILKFIMKHYSQNKIYTKAEKIFLKIK